METPTNNDEYEPNGFKKQFHFGVFSLAIVLLFFASCHQPNKEVKKESPVIDTTVIKQQQQQHSADSIAKAVVHKKKIYLTFDDGPNKGTLNVLNAVKEDSIPASFFIVGTHIDDSPEQQETWKELKADNAIELCNHSYSHAFNHYKKYYQHPDSVIKDIERNQQQLGFNSNIVRMPGRNAWRIDVIHHTDIKESEAAIDSVHQAGFDIIGWDVEWMFDRKTLSLTTGPDLLLRQIENRLKSGKTRTTDHLVLLAHDQIFQTDSSIYQLHYFFSQLKINPEYDLELISSYPGIKKDIHQ
jgi:peptidoglycan/xylan/chitin deacetylase (PgdA/CDA1 family)